VRIARPERRDTALFDVPLSSGSLATSGASERDGAVGGVRLRHILDPRTGLASAFTGSVVVWHERALVADILSTALHVMGERDGIAFADARGLAIAYLVPDVGAGIRVSRSRRFSARFPGVH
jgi:thiamine biosynthesis lipoprotein